MCCVCAKELELLRFRTLGGTARTLQQAVRQLPALTALSVSCLSTFSLEPRNPAGPAAHVWGSVFDGLTALKVRTTVQKLPHTVYVYLLNLNSLPVSCKDAAGASPRPSLLLGWWQSSPRPVSRDGWEHAPAASLWGNMHTVTE